MIENIVPEKEILDEEGTLQRLVQESQKAINNLQVQYSTLIENLTEMQHLLSGRPSLQKKYASQVKELAKQVKEFEERGQTDSTNETTVGDSSATEPESPTAQSSAQPEQKSAPHYQAPEPLIAWDAPDQVATNYEGSGENNDPILKGMEQNQQVIEAKAVESADSIWESFNAYKSEFFPIRTLIQHASYANVYSPESAKTREILNAKIEANRDLVLSKFEDASLWLLYYEISSLSNLYYQIDAKRKRDDQISLLSSMNEYPELKRDCENIAREADNALTEIKKIKSENPNIIAPVLARWNSLVEVKQAIEQARSGNTEAIYNIARTESGVDLPHTIDEIREKFKQLRKVDPEITQGDRVLEVTEIAGSQGSAFSQMRSQRPEQRQEGINLVNEQCVVVPAWYLTRSVKQKIAVAVADGLGIDGYNNRQSRPVFIQSIVDGEPTNILSGYSGGKQYFVTNDQEVPGDLNMLIVGKDSQTGKWSTTWKRMYYPTS